MCIARGSEQVQATDYRASASRLGFSDELTFLSFLLAIRILGLPQTQLLRLDAGRANHALPESGFFVDLPGK